MGNTFKAGYKILPEYKLVIEVCSGLLTLDKYKEYKKMQAEDSSFTPDFNLIAINRDLVIDGLISEVNEYVEFLKQNLNKVTGVRKVCVLNESPNNLVYASIFKNLHKDLPQDYHICKSIEETVKHLGPNINLTVINSIIDEIYNDLIN